MIGWPFVLGFVFLLLAEACGPKQLPPEPPIVVVDTDAGRFEGDADAVTACTNLLFLGCLESQGLSPKGVPCPVWMGASREYLDLTCLGKAKTKNEVVTTCHGRCY